MFIKSQKQAVQGLVSCCTEINKLFAQTWAAGGGCGDLQIGQADACERSSREPKSIYGKLPASSASNVPKMFYW